MAPLGSPYSVQDYLAVNPDYGTHDDVRALTAAAHDLGMRVILDWVANHSAFDCVWTEEHREYYLLLDSTRQPPAAAGYGLVGRRPIGLGRRCGKWVVRCDGGCHGVLGRPIAASMGSVAMWP